MLSASMSHRYLRCSMITVISVVVAFEAISEITELRAIRRDGARSEDVGSA